MAHYHKPPATLKKSEWKAVAAAFASVNQTKAFELLQKTGNKPHRAGDLFAEEDVRSVGQDRINTALRKSGSIYVLGRIGDYLNPANNCAREDRVLALVRRPKK